jgi:hypothetical protein
LSDPTVAAQLPPGPRSLGNARSFDEVLVASGRVRNWAVGEIHPDLSAALSWAVSRLSFPEVPPEQHAESWSAGVKIGVETMRLIAEAVIGAVADYSAQRPDSAAAFAEEARRLFLPTDPTKGSRLVAEVWRERVAVWSRWPPH